MEETQDYRRVKGARVSYKFKVNRNGKTVFLQSQHDKTHNLNPTSKSNNLTDIL